MPTIALPGTDSPSTTSYVSPGSSFYIYSLVTVPFGRTMANGSRNILTQTLNLYVAGRTGTVSLRPWLGGARGSYVGYGAQSTPSKKIMGVNVQTVGGGTHQYGVYWGGGGVNFRRGGGGSTESSGSSSWGSSMSGTITYAEAPAAPTPIGVDQATPTSLRVKFSGNSDGGSGITGWNLQYSKSSNFSNSTTVSSGGTSVISGLTPNTTYYFRAAGKNAVTNNAGTTGPFSTTFSGKTLASTPSAPQNLGLVSLSAVQVRLTWGVPSSNGGSAVTGYKVQRSKSQDFSGATTETLGNVLTWDSPVLDIGTWYFRVRAVNANGDGTWSAVKSNTVTRTGYPNVFIEGSMVKKPVKVYLTDSWAVKPLKVYQSGQWITLL